MKGGVKVKALVWQKTALKNGDEMAQVVNGQYIVANIHGRWAWLRSYVNEDQQQTHKTGYAKDKRAAKAAAQSDYKARILDALEVMP